MAQLLNIKEIARYSVAGISSTLLDWAIYFVLAILLKMHYQLALFIALSLSSILNYKINKYYTFQSDCNKGIRQFTSYFVLVIVSLCFSFVLMHIFIDMLSWGKMSARIITTTLLAVVNYLLTKLIPFNENIFNNH